MRGLVKAQWACPRSELRPRGRRCGFSGIILYSARTIESGLARGQDEGRGYDHSYDMLGEGAPVPTRTQTLFKILCRCDRSHRPKAAKKSSDGRQAALEPSVHLGQALHSPPFP